MFTFQVAPGSVLAYRLSRGSDGRARREYGPAFEQVFHCEPGFTRPEPNGDDDQMRAVAANSHHSVASVSEHSRLPVVVAKRACTVCIGPWLAMSMVFGCVLNAQGSDVRHPLAALKNETGWVLLGAFDVDARAWASVLKHRRTELDPLVPKVGDVLTISMPQKVFIVGFKVNGERDYLASPALTPMSNDNLTGIVLPVDTTVVVQDVQRGQVTARLQLVWARVEIPRK